MKKAIAIDPNFAMAYRSMGAAYGNMQYSRERREALDKALELSENLPFRERLLIQADALPGREKKIEAIQKVLELYPFDGHANAKLGAMYLDREEYVKALEYYEVLIRNNIITPFTINIIVQAYMYAFRYDEAEKLCIKYYDMLSKGKNHPIIRVHLNQGKYDRALEEAIKLEKSTTKNLMGLLLFLKGDFDKAEEKYREMLESEDGKEKFEGRRNLSYLYKAQGKFRAAEEEIRKALEIGEQYNQIEWVWNAISDLIYLKLSLGKAEEALEEWKEYEEAFPKLYFIWLVNLKVNIFVKMKNFEEADQAAQIFKENLDAWQKATGFNKHIRYYNLLQGIIALEQDKLPESILFLKDAVSLLAAGSPGEYAVFMEPLARAYYKAGDLDKAREEYEKITRLTTGRKGDGDIYARSFYRLGKIYEQQDKKSKAIENYEKFLDLWKNADPGIAEVGDARKRLAGLKDH